MVALCFPLLAEIVRHFQNRRNGQPGNHACALGDVLAEVLRREHKTLAVWLES